MIDIFCIGNDAALNSKHVHQKRNYARTTFEKISFDFQKVGTNFSSLFLIKLVLNFLT